MTYEKAWRDLCRLYREYVEKGGDGRDFAADVGALVALHGDPNVPRPAGVLDVTDETGQLTARPEKITRKA
jgi:hypothetical protein